MGIFSNSIAVIEWQQKASDQTLVYRYPNYERVLKLGSKLVVHAGQVAILVSDNQPMDSFLAGTHVLQTDNLPLLIKKQSLPIHQLESISADLYFFNTRNLLSFDFNIDTHANPSVANIQATGQYSLYIVDAKLFLQQWIDISDAQLALECLAERLTLILEKQFPLTLQARWMQSATKPSTADASVIDIKPLSKEEQITIASQLLTATQLYFSSYGLRLETIHLEHLSASQGNAILASIAQLPTENRSETNLSTSGELSPAAKAQAILAEQETSALCAHPAIYYLMLQGNRLGPFNVNDIYAMLDSGQADIDTLFWFKGASAWQCLHEQEEFDVSAYLPSALPE